METVKKLFLPLLIILVLSATVIATGSMVSPLSISNSTTSNSTWYGLGRGDITVKAVNVKPRISYVYFDKWSIEPGAWVTITVRITNDGPDTAPYQTLHIGLPFDPPSSDIQIVSTNLDEAKIYPKGSALGGQYGQITSKYPIVEGYARNLGSGVVKELVVKVKLPDSDTVAFDLKTVACDENWKVLARDPSSGMLDQQGEYVRPYLLLRKITVTVPTTGSVDVSVKIINHNRYVPSQAGTQPSMRVDSFTVADWGGLDKSKVTITATNIGLTIAPGSVGTLNIRITTSNHPSGTYTIYYSVTGSP
jgi:hypothetical protein